MKKTIISLISLISFAAVSPAQVTDTLELAKQAATTVENLILGKVSGVDVTSQIGSKVSSVNTLIRGINSLKTASNPLWIIDGVILNDPAEVDSPFWQFGSSTFSADQNSFLGFNVYDIESVEVLKNISATSLYGSRGANGVIIINTRFPEKTRNIGLQWNSDLDVMTMSHAHSASLSGNRNSTNYFISGYYRNCSCEESGNNFGGMRFNFRSKANKTLQLGLNSAVSLGNLSSLNPLLDPDSDMDDDASEFRTTDSFYMDFFIGNNLKLRADVGVDYRVKHRNLWYGTSTDLGLANNGAANISSMALFNYNASFSADWFRYLGKNKLGLSAGASAIGRDSEYSVMCAFDFFDYSLRAKGLSLGSNTSTNRSNSFKENTAGGFAKVAYDYDNIVGLDASVRLDKTAVYDEDFVIYPSADVWFDLGRALLKDCNAISTLKLKGGWGKAGRQTLVPYQWTSVYSQQVPAIDLGLQAFYDGFFRSISREYNAGVEMGFFADRVKLEAACYDKLTDENFRFYCIGEEFGENGFWRYKDREIIYEENGSISNRGVEIDFSSDLIKTGDFCWNLSFNGAFNLNTVESVPYLDSTFDKLADRWITSNTPGFSAHQICGYSLNEDGTLYDRTGDGTISETDMMFLGALYPKYVYGISTTLTCGRLAIDALLYGRLGSNFVDAAYLFNNDIGSMKSVLTPTGVLSGNCFRPSRVSASYDIPLGRISERMGMKVNLTYAERLPAFGYTAFEQTKSVIGGVCLTF